MDTYDQFMVNTQALRDVIIPLRGDSTEVAASFDADIQVLFIDGDHSYEGCKKDVSAWIPKMVDSGLVIFHDYTWAEGVRRVISEQIVPIKCGRGGRLHSLYWTHVKRAG